jgi:hypothetical protein
MADKYDKCRTCAAMVADAYRHRQWHEALDLQSRKVEKRLRTWRPRPAVKASQRRMWTPKDGAHSPL